MSEPPSSTPQRTLQAACPLLWRGVSAQILSRPIFASAISLNPSADHSLLETLDEVLSAPVRHHFTIVNVTATDCDLQALLKLARDHLGIHTPIVISSTFGVFGRHAPTDEVIEVQMGGDDSEGHAIALTVGFLPGLKVDVIPLLQPQQDPNMALCEAAADLLETINIWYIPRKKDFFSKPKDILTAAEESIAENGTEEFEKLIHRADGDGSGRNGGYTTYDDEYNYY